VRTASEPDAPDCVVQVDERPAVTQDQRENDQPWELAGGHSGERADESIEFVRDVEFVEEGGDEPTRPLQTVGAVRDFLQQVIAVAGSEVLNLDASARRGT
jgi:hypothetical protein